MRIVLDMDRELVEDLQDAARRAGVPVSAIAESLIVLGFEKVYEMGPPGEHEIESVKVVELPPFDVRGTDAHA